MRLLITGASGLLGQKTVHLALQKNHEVYSMYKENPTNLGKAIKLDLTNVGKILKVITRLRPEAIIHTAAYTNVDGCEINKDIAWNVNAEATKQIAIASTNINAHLAYVSTDYVFDGEKGLYSEEDKPSPIDHYGYTKLEGEEFTKEHSQEWCITRTSVIYGLGQTQKLNFATWIINNLNKGKEVRIVTDQFVSPTLNTNLAEMLLEIVERRITGIFHTAGATRTSRHEFARKLAQIFDLDSNLIKPIKMNDLLWKAKRPKDSSLNVSKASALLNARPLKLNEALTRMKKESIKAHKLPKLVFEIF